SSPLSITLLLLLYAANVYAAFEVSIFRNYHPGLVCGVAAVAPVLGPILFLCLPARVMKSHDQIAAESMAHHLAEAPHLVHAHGVAHAGHDAHPGEEAAAAAPAAPEQPKVTAYQRGQTTFNRRFFETKFAGFLRMVPGEEEKNMVIFIRSA